MAILKFILTLFLIYLVVRLLYQLVVPAPVRQMISTIRATMKQMNNPSASTYGQGQDESAQPEGSVTITNESKRSAQKGSKLSDSGEYVDYEEID